MGANVKTTKDQKPKRPKVDRGAEFEQLLRPMFVRAVDIWCKDQLEEQPTKDQKGNVVDNLTASFSSALETTVDAATDSYMSSVVEDDDEVGDEDDDDDDDDDDDVDGEDDEVDDDD